ncbi:reverse transcriptase domain-containing protein [Tanacetum coccineum]
MLVRDRRAHARIAKLMEIKARMYREAWGRSMDVSDLACTEVMALRTQVIAQRSEIAELRTAYRRRQTWLTKALKLMKTLQTQFTALQSQQGPLEHTKYYGTVGNIRCLCHDLEGTKKEDGLTSTLLCPTDEIKNTKLAVGFKSERMFPKESDKIERYVGGLPGMIHRSVVASKPKTMQEATKITTKLVDKRIRTFADLQTKNKRKQDNNQQQQPQNKMQNTSRAYTAGTGEKKLYGGSKPLCPKCNYHYDGPCAPRCHKYNRVIHLACDCRSPANANTANYQRGTGTCQKPTCYKCGAQGDFKRECPKLKNNNNRGNPAGNVNAPAKVYVVCHAGTNPDSNVVTGTFLLNNRYASILFDTSADRSFVSTAFSPQIDITPTALDHYYDVELADGRIIGLNTILRGCTLNILCNTPIFTI